MPAAIVLILIAALTAADPPAPARIPGTKLSLGMTEEQLVQAGGESARPATVRFFGVPCQTKFSFRDGQLERVTFEAEAVSPQSIAYVEDQMRRSKLWRECVRLEPGHRICDWLGAVRIHFEVENGRLSADVTAPFRLVDESAPVAAATAMPEAPAMSSAALAAELASRSAAKRESTAAAQLDVSRPQARATSTAATALATAPSGPAQAPATSAGRKTPSLAPVTAAVKPVQKSPDPPPASATEKAPAPAKHSAAKAKPPEVPADGVATLPDTLRISLPERNPPTVWPRMEIVPPLEYPEAARGSGAQGIVWVMALIDPDGSVRSARIDRGIAGLNDAALAWVSKARFAPCEREGQGCRFWVRVAARFTP